MPYILNTEQALKTNQVKEMPVKALYEDNKSMLDGGKMWLLS